MDPLMKIPPYLTREEHEVSSKNDEKNSAEVSPEAELRTPDEWCRIQGVQVLDPDGWRGSNGRPWADPISLAEFQDRLVGCTQRVSPGTAEAEMTPENMRHLGTLDPATGVLTRTDETTDSVTRDQMSNLARVVLIDAALLKAFCDEQDSLREFMDNHNAEASPYAHCSDNVCRHARRQADEILTTLSAAGFTITKETE